MLVNLQFDPMVNAAYSVAFGLSTQATSLSQSLTSAFRPAVISAEGKGERAEMLRMAMQTCRFGSLLIILFAIPLILEMQNLLDIWLGEPPEFAAPICQWMLAMLIVERITTGHMIAVNAYGKIGLYEVLQGAAFLSSLPLMWGMFQLGWGPEAVGVALFGSALLFCAIRVVFAKYLLDFPVLLWLRRVVWPILLILVIVSIIGSISMSGFSEGFLRLLLASVTCVLATVSLAWIILFDYAEREFIYRIMVQLLHKIPYLRRHIERRLTISE
jgi:O-antigen/teichoic acid export membrane protein